MKGQKITIATLYSYQPIIAGVLKLGSDILYLLIDKTPDDQQKKGIEEIKKTVGKIVKLKEVSTPVYDIVNIAKITVDIIDSCSTNDEIILNISGARKTKSLGLLYGGYARSKRISKMVYITKEDNEVIFLPILSFHLNKSHRKILANVKDTTNYERRYYSLGMSRSMYFKTVKELREMGLLDEDNVITSAGEISIL